MRSQRAARAAWDKGLFKDEVVPVEVRQGRNVMVVDEDDHMRPQTNLEDLAKLPPAFSKDGFVTAGNASGIVDGGAAVVVASEAAVKARGLQPLARIVNYDYVGVEPDIMGIGPVPAIQSVLAREASWRSRTSTSSKSTRPSPPSTWRWRKSSDLDRDRVNVNGGAIALGHPLGASGTRITLTLALETEAARGAGAASRPPASAAGRGSRC